MKRFWVGLLQGLFCLLICVAAGLALLMACDWLYRADIRLLDIPGSSGLDETVILANYRAAVRYLTPWNDANFALEGLSWSVYGAEYFRRLRICVLCIYILGLLGGIGLICLHGARRRLGRRVWNVSGTVTLGLAALIGVLMALDFTRVLTGFCGLALGESWKLYEDVDPIVTLFPQSFFLHAAFFLIFCCVTGSLLQFAAGYSPAGAAAGSARKKQPSAAAAKRPSRPKASPPPRSDAPEKKVFRQGETF